MKMIAFTLNASRVFAEAIMHALSPFFFRGNNYLVEASWNCRNSKSCNGDLGTPPPPTTKSKTTSGAKSCSFKHLVEMAPSRMCNPSASGGRGHLICAWNNYLAEHRVSICYNWESRAAAPCRKSTTRPAALVITGHRACRCESRACNSSGYGQCRMWR